MRLIFVSTSVTFFELHQKFFSLPTVCLFVQPYQDPSSGESENKSSNAHIHVPHKSVSVYPDQQRGACLHGWVNVMAVLVFKFHQVNDNATRARFTKKVLTQALCCWFRVSNK